MRFLFFRLSFERDTKCIFGQRRTYTSAITPFFHCHQKHLVKQPCYLRVNGSVYGVTGRRKCLKVCALSKVHRSESFLHGICTFLGQSLLQDIFQDRVYKRRCSQNMRESWQEVCNFCTIFRRLFKALNLKTLFFFFNNFLINFAHDKEIKFTFEFFFLQITLKFLSIIFNIPKLY